MVRWAPLGEYLRACNDERVELTYEQIEDIVGEALPASATDHRPQFWANSMSHSHGKQWLGAGYRTDLNDIASDAVAFVRDGTGAERRADVQVRHHDVDTTADVILVGCTKRKEAEARPARDLYTSPMFRKRQEFAESSGRPWVVLSAEYGAVDPDEVIEPYDRFLEDQSEAYKLDWADDVVEQLEMLHGPLDGRVFELHASQAYGDPIAPLLRAHGATLLRPMHGLRRGEQLQWYGQEGRATISPPTATSSRTSRRAHDRVPEDTRGLAARITHAFVGGELDLSTRPAAPEPGWAGMPELHAVQRVRDAGGHDVDVRLFLTLISAMDRARDADRLWRLGADAFASTHWIFDTRSVVRRSFSDLGDALRTTGLSQRHSVDVGAWRIICESLDDTTIAPVISTALIDGYADARELISAVQARSSAGGDRFPLLRGPKIRAMWVRMLAHPGGVRVENLDVVPVAVDVQVRKVTETSA